MQLNPVRAAENDDNEEEGGNGGKTPAASPSYKQAVSKAITRFISPADATLSQCACVCGRSRRIRLENGENKIYISKR